MRIDVGTARAVGIGSMRGDVQLRLHYLAWNGRFNAEDAVGLGTLEGNKCYIDIFNANIIVDMRAYKACGLGTHHGEVLIELDSGAVLVSGSGTEAIAWGSRFKKAQIKMTAARMESRMATTLDTDMGVEVQNISIDGGECYYNVN